MPRFSLHLRRVTVIPCDHHAKCYRYLVASTDGLRHERSGYAYANAHCARLVGELRARQADARIQDLPGAGL